MMDRWLNQPGKKVVDPYKWIVPVVPAPPPKKAGRPRIHPVRETVEVLSPEEEDELMQQLLAEEKRVLAEEEAQKKKSARTTALSGRS